MTPTQWVVEYGGSWVGGEHIMELQVSDPNAGCFPGGCPLVRSITFRTTDLTDPLTMRTMYFFPNLLLRYIFPSGFLFMLSSSLPFGNLAMWLVVL